MSIPVVVPQATLSALAAMRLTQVSSDDPLPPDGGGGGGTTSAWLREDGGYWLREDGGKWLREEST